MTTYSPAVARPPAPAPATTAATTTATTASTAPTGATPAAAPTTGMPRGFSLIDPSTLATATPTLTTSRSTEASREASTEATPAQRTPSATPRAALASSTGQAFAQVMAEVSGASTSLAVRQRQTPAVAEPAGRALAEPARSTLPEPATPVAARLIDLGMPRALANQVTGTDIFGEMLAALRSMPPPPRPPQGAGDVLVIAGEVAYALPIARTVAQSLHLDPGRILLAAPSTAGTGLHASRRISGPAEAERRGRQMHRAEVPHVVVVDAPVTAGDDGWVRSITEALGATAIWAAVDATRKLADTARHLETMGRVDALAVYAASVCSDPAGVLALDVPVALLDGRPATPAAWAALLTERLHTLPAHA